jgi:large subunit ribosomal protein L18
MKVRTKQQSRQRRHLRIRRKVHGTAERPRMSVFVSKKHFYVQFIDDEQSRTLAQVSTAGTSAPATGKHNRDTAKALGKVAGERALAQGITEVVFDRGGFAYGARIRALADAAREAGLKF